MAIECVSAAIDRGSIMTTVHKISMVVYSSFSNRHFEIWTSFCLQGGNLATFFIITENGFMILSVLFRLHATWLPKVSMVPSDPFMSHLATHLGYSPGEFQALQLIVVAAFGVVDSPLASCMLVHFFKSTFKQQLGLRFDIMDCKSSFFVFWYMQFYMF